MRDSTVQEPTRRRRRSLLGLLTTALVAGAVVALTATPSGATTDFDDVSGRLMRPGLAFDTGLCPTGPLGEETPVAFASGSILLVDPSPTQLNQVLVLVNGTAVTHPFGVVEIDLANNGPGDTLSALDEVRTAFPGLVSGLVHVFNLSPFWKFRPEASPVRAAAAPPEPTWGVNRDIVVVDTGYLRTAPPPSYTVSPDSVISSLQSPVTAHHGPFIASQIANLVDDPSRVRLERVRVEEGVLPPASPGDEELFDEIALVRTLAAAGMVDEVLNLSLGTYGCADYFPIALFRALESLHESGVDTAAAAGNDQTFATSFPAAFGAAGRLSSAWAPGRERRRRMPSGPASPTGATRSRSGPRVRRCGARSRPRTDR